MLVLLSDGAGLVGANNCFCFNIVDNVAVHICAGF